ncbi:uncharacterized protein N7503_011842 [Penicillium pulvis]|uniref:uncharacterized protein n=1 Tax=Penicillium pulvis TaxID=1562058 RepID=UPI00254710D7|nr:uncharacterized protein N7503_011842 [Penicillium pulvis]KAJ5786630.1 hypothetical protein N7503_011842 [Penicillium pulvis]
MKKCTTRSFVKVEGIGAGEDKELRLDLIGVWTSLPLGSSQRNNIKAMPECGGSMEGSPAWLLGGAGLEPTAAPPIPHGRNQEVKK